MIATCHVTVTNSTRLNVFSVASGSRRFYSTEVDLTFQEGKAAEDLQGKVTELEQKLSALTDAFEAHVKKSDAKTSDENLDGGDTAAALTSQVVKEMSARAENKRCLRFYDIPTSASALHRGRKADDRIVIEKILKDVLDVQVDVVDHWRIHGRAGTQLQGNPLVVKFRSESQKDAVCDRLRATWADSDPEGMKIRATPCFTKMQWREINEELTRRNDRADAGGFGRPHFVSVDGRIAIRRIKGLEDD